MKPSFPLTLARRLGIVLAICVPAWVVAQPMLPTFGRGQVLQAEQLNALVAAVNALQANAGVALTKQNLYSIRAESPPITQNNDGVAVATCADPNDVIVSCQCQGLLGTSNSPQIDLRRAGSSNREDGSSFCVCQGVNVLSDAPRILVASGECLPIP